MTVSLPSTLHESRNIPKQYVLKLSCTKVDQYVYVTSAQVILYTELGVCRSERYNRV